MRRYLLMLALMLMLAACAATREAPARLRLATTTSTEDSGLLQTLLPEFEQRYGLQVDVIAVGTGQALEIARRGDADVVLVHARQLEEQFVQEGHGSERRDVMYNDFIIVGPPADPAGVRQGQDILQALRAIAESKVLFASRGDGSGTHTREIELWEQADLNPQQQDWYRSLGQGMGETLIFAAEQRSYTLTDRGTYLAMRDKLPDLAILFGGETIAANPDRRLFNIYGVIPVSNQRHAGVNSAAAQAFADWITSEQIQQRIAAFGSERYGQPLFHPAASYSLHLVPETR